MNSINENDDDLPLAVEIRPMGDSHLISNQLIECSCTENRRSKRTRYQLTRISEVRSVNITRCTEYYQLDEHGILRNITEQTHWNERLPDGPITLALDWWQVYS